MGSAFLLIFRRVTHKFGGVSSLTVIVVFVVMPEREFIKFNGVGEFGKDMNQGIL